MKTVESGNWQLSFRTWTVARDQFAASPPETTRLTTAVGGTVPTGLFETMLVDGMKFVSPLTTVLPDNPPATRLPAATGIENTMLLVAPPVPLVIRQVPSKVPADTWFSR